MTFGSITAVEVRGHIGIDDAHPASGWVDFIYRKPLRNDAGNIVIAPQSFRATLVNGSFIKVIPATNDPNGSPVGYPVLVHIVTDQMDDKFEADVPWDTPGWLDFEVMAERQPFISAVRTHALLGHIHLAMPVRQLESGLSTINIDASRGTHFRLTMTQNATLAKPTNGRDGQRILLETKQDVVGGHTLTPGTGVHLGVTISSFALSTVGGKRDYTGLIFNQDEDLWDIIALAKGY